MKIAHEKFSCLALVALGSVIVLFCQTGCRRSGEAEAEREAAAGSGQTRGEAAAERVTEGDPDRPAESGKPDASEGKSGSLMERIEACQARLRAIAAESAALQKEIARARRRLRVENTEIAAMVKQVSELRKNLSDRTHALPGTEEQMKQRTELLNEIRELHKQRENLAKRAASEDPDKLRQEGNTLNDEIRAKSETVRKLSVEIDKMRREARDNDPEVKKLAAELVEKERSIEARIKAYPEVTSLVEKREGLTAEARRITERMKELRETMEREPASRDRSERLRGTKGSTPEVPEDDASGKELSSN